MCRGHIYAIYTILLVNAVSLRHEHPVRTDFLFISRFLLVLHENLDQTSTEKKERDKFPNQIPGIC